jgi:hypothetical protein
LLSLYKRIPERVLHGFLVFFERFALPPDDCRRLSEWSWYVGVEQIRNNLHGTEEPSRD